MVSSGPTYHLTKYQKAKILILRTQGLTYSVIAERMGVTVWQVGDWCRKARKN